MFRPAREPSGDITLRLIAGRVAVVTILLSTLTAIQLLRPQILPYPRSEQLYRVIIATYLLSLAYIGAAARGLRSEWFHKGQIAIDILLASLVVVYSGGLDSPFTFIYPVIILAASVVFHHRETFAVAAACMVTYGGLVLVQHYFPLGVLFPYPVPAESPVYVAYTLFLTFLAFFLVAFLGDYLTNALRRAGRELDRQREDLADLQAQTQHIFRSLVSGLVTADLTGRVLAINPAGEAILGIPAGTAAGHSVGTLFHGGGGISDFLSNPSDEPHRTEMTYPREDAQGTGITIGLTASKLVNDRGEHTGFLVIFQDLTPIRAMEEEVRRSQRLAAIGEMAAGLAHELKNPLAPIAGSVEMLREKVDEQDRPLIELILRETERLDHLVNNFLQYARPLPLSPAPVDLDGLIADLLSLIGREGRFAHGITLTFRPGLQRLVMLDQRMILQVLWNLISNAAEAITPPGEIVIATQFAAGRARVTVTDTGEGIPAEQLGQVFTPFFTTKDTGTGLGLSISERIITLHGGTVSIDSAIGRGTAVSFTIAEAGASGTEREVAHGGAVDPRR